MASPAMPRRHRRRKREREKEIERGTERSKREDTLKANASAFSQSEAGSVGPVDLGPNIDTQTFEQILEMDDDEDDREFSRSIVFGFFDQAEQTFTEMEEAL